MQMRDILAGAQMLARRHLGLAPNPNFDFAGSEVHCLPPEHSRSRLADIFQSHRGRIAHKWTHFLDIYDRHFAGYRSQPVRLLEIGVNAGGSLELWREYFGPAATIFGVDVDDKCNRNVDAPNRVMIGSQDDPQFLRRVVAEMGAPDIIIDDGSHIGRHQVRSFNTLFPLLSDGGVYVIEDLHTAYWPGPHEGGHARWGTGIELVKGIIDDMHAWYHRSPTSTDAMTRVGGVHIYDSIAFIEKARRGPPRRMEVGRPRHTGDTTISLPSV